MEGRSIAMMCVSLLLTACATAGRACRAGLGGTAARGKSWTRRGAGIGESIYAGRVGAERGKLGEHADGGGGGRQVMFPRWVVSRKGAQKYEVLFTYTLLRDDYGIEKKGVSVDGECGAEAG